MPLPFAKIWICALNTIYVQQWCTSQSLSSFLRDKKTPSSFFAWHSLTLVSAIDDHIQLRLDQGFPTFFAARTRLSGQSILSTPKKFLRYILLYKRYISCSVTQGSSYPLGVRVPPVGNPWCRLSRMRNRQLIVTLSRITPTRHGRIPTPQYHAATCANIVARELRQQISRSRGQSSPVVAETHFQPPKVFTSC